MKKLLWLACLTISMLSARAATETVNGITWTYHFIDNDGVKSVEIYAGNTTAAINTSTSGDIMVPSTLGGKQVTSVGNYAFWNCNGLTGITIPAGVTKIGYNTFCSCYSLKYIVIPEGVTSIGNLAFQNCWSLESLTIPSTLSYNCSLLDAFMINGREGFAGYPLFSGVADGEPYILGDWLLGYNGDAPASVIIPSNIKHIASSAFSNCSLTSVTIPSSVVSIGSSAFSGCALLTSVTIPSSVVSIGYGAFMGCWDLQSVTLAEGLESIDRSAFYDCESLESIIIPASVTNVSYSVFDECLSLTSVTFKGNNSTSDWYSFYSNTPTNLTTYISYSATGWPTAYEGDTWQDRPIRYYDHSTSRDSIVYTVTFDANGGNCATKSVQVKAGNSIILPTATTTEKWASLSRWEGEYQSQWGYTSGIWCRAGEEFYPEADTTFTAMWSRFSNEGCSEEDGEYDGTKAHTYDGTIYLMGNDYYDDYRAGIIQIVAKKATKKGVTLSGSVMLGKDAKKLAIKAVTGQIVDGMIDVVTTVKGLGEIEIILNGCECYGVIGNNEYYFELWGNEGDDEDDDCINGIAKGTLKISYYDKNHKLKTKSVTVTGTTHEHGDGGIGSCRMWITERGKTPFEVFVSDDD